MDKKKKVCIGLSGGVDSSVAAYLLKKQGYDVFAMFMQNWHDVEGTLHGECEWEEERFVAEMVARKIGIPFYFVDLSKQYRSRVVDYMFDEYSKGRTPNPDVLCNSEIKFDAFIEAAEKLGAEYVATGHYCRKDVLEKEDGTRVYKLLAGVDPGKDQSYFLCQLTQEQLAKAVFPIGELNKKEVRELAAEADLPSATKKDSQGICFVGKVDLPVFLQQKLESVEGNVVEVYDKFYTENEHYLFIKATLESILSQNGPDHISMVTSYISDDKSLNKVGKRSVFGNPDNEGGCLGVSPFDRNKVEELTDEQLLKLSEPISYSNIKFKKEYYRSGKKHIKKMRYAENPFGKIVGTHDGAQFYTIGQRKGLNIGGHKDSLFVIETDVKNNIIYVGEGHAHKGLSRSCLKMAPSEVNWIRSDIKMAPGEVRRYRVRIRYRQPLQDAYLIMRDNGLYVLFDEPQRGITPGQFATWYNDDELVGSGVIL